MVKHGMPCQVSKVSRSFERYEINRSCDTFGQNWLFEQILGISIQFYLKQFYSNNYMVYYSVHLLTNEFGLKVKCSSANVLSLKKFSSSFFILFLLVPFCEGTMRVVEIQLYINIWAKFHSAA